MIQIVIPSITPTSNRGLSYVIIISDSVYDRYKKPRYGIEVLLELSRYQRALGNERINTKTNKYK